MKITILVEGATERVFIPFVRDFLQSRNLPNGLPKIDPYIYDGRIPTNDKLRRVVERLLSGRNPSDAVIALTDVYTGQRDFTDATDAKAKMRSWVGSESKFYPHVALYDFEAWLLPFWVDIQRLAGTGRSAPGPKPGLINHNNPPAHRLKEIFRTGSTGRHYVKPRDAARILSGKDLAVAAQACPELKAFLNTLLCLCGGDILK